MDFYCQEEWIHIGNRVGGEMYAQLPHVVAVAYQVAWVETDQQSVLHLPKQLTLQQWATNARLYSKCVCFIIQSPRVELQLPQVKCPFPESMST